MPRRYASFSLPGLVRRPLVSESASPFQTKLSRPIIWSLRVCTRLETASPTPSQVLLPYFLLISCDHSSWLLRTAFVTSLTLALNSKAVGFARGKTFSWKTTFSPPLAAMANVNTTRKPTDFAIIRMQPNVQAQAQAREVMPQRSRGAANLPCHPKLKAQRLLPAARGCVKSRP